MTGTLWCPDRQIYSLGKSDGDHRDAWLAARKTKLTASDLASVIGIGYRRRSEVLDEKLGTERGGNKDDKVHAMAQVEAGRYMEPGIIRWFADQHLGKVEECGELLYRDCSRPWIAATPDALVDGDPLEVKNVAQESQYNWALNTTPRDGWPDHLPFPVPVHAEGNWAMATNKVAAKWKGTPTGAWREHFVKVRTELLPTIGAPCAPVKLVVQLYVQMFVLKRTEGVMTACIGGVNRLDLYYTMHAPTMAWLLEQADEFWADVQSRRL